MNSEYGPARSTAVAQKVSDRLAPLCSAFAILGSRLLVRGYGGSGRRAEYAFVRGVGCRDKIVGAFSGDRFYVRGSRVRDLRPVLPGQFPVNLWSNIGMALKPRLPLTPSLEGVST